MQKFLFPLLVAVGLSLSAAAQSGPPQASSRPQHSPAEMAARQTKHLAKRLDLSAEQAAKVQQILAARTQEMQALRAAGSARPSREQMQANRATYDGQLQQVLTPDQRTKYMAMQAERRQHGPRASQGKAQEGKVKIKTKPTDS